ncbi:MAG: hypothetical protein RL266_1821 [Bacteroidota bacterium]
MSSLLEYLLRFATENKRQLIASRLEERTRYITVVLEDIYESQNASAVLRSADCFGIQDVHIIENTNQYQLNPNVVKGATKWLHVHRYSQDHDNTTHCINQLKSKGYRIVATSPSASSVSLQELPLDEPLALLFGTEKLGLSANAFELADYHMYIPMYGFTESLNISVSAAICLQYLAQKLRESNLNWQLSEEEKNALHYEWVRKVVNKPEILERSYWAENEGH